jgi:acetyl esterase/lipase
LTASEQNLGFLQPGDPRSELVLSLFKDGNGLSLLLNGFGSSKSATEAQIRLINPMAQIQNGVYRTPTFIIHGDRDEVVPHSMGANFIRALTESGVDAEMALVPMARHIFDLKLKPGDKLWEEYIRPGYEFLFQHL